MTDWIWIIASVAVAVAGYIWRRETVKGIADAAQPKRLLKQAKAVSTILFIAGVYLLMSRSIGMIFGPAEAEGMQMSIWPARTSLLGMDLSMTVISTWVAMAFLIAFALLLRLTVLRRLSDPPGGAHNVLELIVEQIMGYVDTKAHGAGEILGSYVFTIASFLIACAVLELFGIRTPASDITLTFALALMTFFLINWYGIKKKGVGGRIKSLASPTPVVLIIRVITDLAIPVSMASRLFGNMLGGMIVMDLIYSSLGNGALGFPRIA